MDRVRVGLVGCGIISGPHIEGYRAIPEKAQVVATADVDLDRARAAAELAGAARTTTDYHDLITDPGIDALDLCLPHHLHREATIAALAAGKHVLCQKPIANTLEDADVMIAAAERSGRTFMIAENRRFTPEVGVAQKLIAEGAIGKVHLVQSMCSYFQGGAYLETPWRFDAAKLGGGALLDAGIHHVDVLLQLLGRPQAVSCLTYRVRDLFPTEDTALVIARFEGGALGELMVAWSSPHVRPMIFRACGAEGSITGYAGSVEVLSNLLPERQVVETDLGLGFKQQIAHFVECVLTGARPAMGGTEARADLEFVLAAYESASTGRHVAL